MPRKRLYNDVDERAYVSKLQVLLSEVKDGHGTLDNMKQTGRDFLLQAFHELLNDTSVVLSDAFRSTVNTSGVSGVHRLRQIAKANGVDLEPFSPHVVRESDIQIFVDAFKSAVTEERRRQAKEAEPRSRARVLYEIHNANYARFSHSYRLRFPAIIGPDQTRIPDIYDKFVNNESSVWSRMTKKLRRLGYGYAGVFAEKETSARFINRIPAQRTQTAPPQPVITHLQVNETSVTPADSALHDIVAWVRKHAETQENLLKLETALAKAAIHEQERRKLFEAMEALNVELRLEVENLKQHAENREQVLMAMTVD